MAEFFVSVGSIDITGVISSIWESITVTDSSGKSSDTCSLELNDAQGQIEIPPTGEAITIGLAYSGPPVILFEGFVDDVSSRGARSGGMMLTITGKSADVTKGKVKSRHSKHKDKGTLKDAATEFGQASGVTDVQVHADLAAIEREHWSLTNESFMAWGERVARSYGATFKIMGPRAVFVPRGMGISASGQPLVPIIAARGDNLLDWNIKPTVGRPQHAKFKTRRYDLKASKWMHEEAPAEYDTDAEAELTSRWTEPGEDEGMNRSKSNAKESDRERGGGSASIIGNPAAQSEGTCTLVGTRTGVDGDYRMDTVTHTLSRGGGYETQLTLKQPGGPGGKSGGKGGGKKASTDASGAGSLDA